MYHKDLKVKLRTVVIFYTPEDLRCITSVQTVREWSWALNPTVIWVTLEYDLFRKTQTRNCFKAIGFTGHRAAVQCVWYKTLKKKSNKMDLIVATGCCATATTGPWFRNLWTKCKRKWHNLRGTFTPVDNEPMKVQFICKIFLTPKVPGNMHWKQIVSTPTSTHAHRKRGDEHRHAHYDMYANHLNTI